MKLASKGCTEFSHFDGSIQKLISVSYEELQSRLKVEERAKKKRKAAKPSAASLASGEDS